ncbi:DUF1883 domain-containing protein [Carnobacterium sp. CS13]|uniref:DUF1883 domain-containing protein n=1 Tax=Carnobacterium sp. CS13 TaxID=2800128 RepID=UPI0019128677|nr:DUF1883 domain-containing protein [Carnobacterium sp. CS13]QQP71175.1 DUF1883 domain-containing protein [Carnobacterium sp. CS13]
MVQVPYVESTGTVSVKVHLKHAADVFLVNQSNFQKYKSGQSYQYFGGHYTQTPVVITANGIGRFYLVVQNGGEYRYSFF